MDPKGSVPVTKELDDINYVCPKCHASYAGNWVMTG